MKVIKPKRLRHGDVVSLISVSSPVPSEESVDQMVQCLNSFGLEVDVDPHVFERLGYLAGPDDVRIKSLNKALSHDKRAAVFFAWGGKGANHLLSEIDYTNFRQHPRIVVGLSDPTSIINALNSQSNVVTFHGPTGVNFSAPGGLAEYTETSFLETLFEARPVGKIKSYSQWEVIKSGKARGPLVGGHLPTVQTLLGTPYEPKWDGAVFFWEEIGRTARSIDLSLWHFRNAGVFDRIAGIIVGRPLDCNDAVYDADFDLIAAVRNACRGYNFPILYNVDLGHPDPKLTLPIGIPIEMDLSDEKNPVLIINEACVEA
jgi:muramoyltetrapeptide carboxypeptidase